MRPRARASGRPGAAAIGPAVAAVLAAATAATPARAAPTAAEAAPPPILSATAPAPGAYEADFCVAVAAVSAQCGPVAADVRDGGRVHVRIADIVYRLEPWGDRLGITLMHGTMQIDGFFAPYEWVGSSLQFLDIDKRTRYELQLKPVVSTR